MALPLLVAVRATEPQVLTAIDGLGIGLFAVGFGFEVVGDSQLERFKADPRNRGTVLDTGLWRAGLHGALVRQRQMDADQDCGNGETRVNKAGPLTSG